MISHRALLTWPKMACQSQRSGRLVWSAPMNSVDSSMMTATPSTTGSQTLIQYFRPRLLLLDTIVGRLAGDDDVVDVTFAQSGAGDAHEMRLLLQLGDAAAAHVAHAGAQAADKLEDHRLQRAAVGTRPSMPSGTNLARRFWLARSRCTTP